MNHKYFQSLTMVLAVLVCAATVHAGTGGKISARVQLPDVQIHETASGPVPVMHGLDYSGQPGQPRLPVMNLTLVLPPNASGDNLKARVVEAREKSMSANSLAPVGAMEDLQDTSEDSGQEAKSVASKKSLELDPDIYGQDVFFPAQVLGGVRLDEHSGYVLAHVTISPVRYNDARGEIVVLEELDVEIEFQTTSADNDSIMVRSDKYLENLVAAQGVQSWSEVEAMYAPFQGNWDPFTGLVLSGSTDLEIDPDMTYLIITTRTIYADRLLNGLSQFISHKELLGETVMVAAVEDIYAEYSGADEPEEIKLFIWECWLDSDVENVLIIGNPDPNAQQAYVSASDPGMVPMRTCTVNNADADTGLTDMYYTDFATSSFKDWDSDSDGLYGESWTGGIGRPDLPVGRIAPVGGYVDDIRYDDGSTMVSVTAREKLRTVLEKMILFDRQVDKTWRYNHLALSSWMYGIGPASEYGVNYGNSAVTLYYTWYYVMSENSNYFPLDQVTQDGYQYASYVDDMWHDGTGMEADDAMEGSSSTSTGYDMWIGNNYGLVYWRGHGSWSSTSIGDDDDASSTVDDGFIDTTDGSLIRRTWFLDNNEMDNEHPSVVFSASCNNFSTGQGAYSKGDYDLQRAKWASLAQALLYKGAISVVAATNTTASELSCPAYPVTGQSAWYQREFFVNLASGMSMGQAYLQSKISAWEYFDDESDYKGKLRDWLRINFLGDPAQKMVAYMPDDAFDASIVMPNDDKSYASQIFDASSAPMYSRFGSATIRNDDLVCQDADWYKLVNLGSGRKSVTITIERDIDQWDDVELWAQTSGSYAISGTSSSDDDTRVLEIAETTESEIYIYVGPEDYATDYNLVVQITNLDKEPFGSVVPGGKLH